jgi:hypothetical protein
MCVVFVYLHMKHETYRKWSKRHVVVASDGAHATTALH